MRKVNVVSNQFTEVTVLDEPGQGNACHEYAVSVINDDDDSTSADVVARVKFQNGPVKEFGINGCHQEDLLAIVIDRLESFQAGDFACDDNQEALDHIKEAMKCLNRRTSERQKRGVEGTNIK